MTDTLLGVSRLRHPISQVTIEHLELPFLDWSVTTTGHFAADTFSVTVPIGRLPKEIGLDFWAVTDRALVEIWVGFDDPDLPRPQSLILGMVDKVDFDMAGRTLRLSGRDLSARFMEAKSIAKFPDLFSSEIVQRMAERQGLSADVQRTTTKVGRFYEQNTARMGAERTEWSILSQLAEAEGFDLWVRNETLYFHPPVDDSQVEPYDLTWVEPSASAPAMASMMAPHITRDIRAAPDVEVTVHSWQPGREDSVTATATAKSLHPDGAKEPRKVSVTRSNLYVAEAQALAKRLAAQEVQHEFTLTASRPADLDLSPRSLIRTSGFGAWDGFFRSTSVTRSFSRDKGFTMNFTAKNKLDRSVEGK